MMEDPQAPPNSEIQREFDEADQINMNRLVREVSDAIELMEFAISQGRAVADTIIKSIKKAEGFLRAKAPWPRDQDRAAFEEAYRDLAQFMKPITIDTLRATKDGKDPNGRWIRKHFRASDAKWYSRQLWCWVVLCALVIVFEQVYRSDEESSGLAVFGKPLMPFLYGLLGGLTYLLRSAHAYIAERSFDLNRLPEYYNRMLLGFLSGGVVLLFVNPESVGAGQSAVSFLVGYNNDYLFQTIERLATAIFPKVTLSASTKDSSKDIAPGIAKVVITKKSLKAGDAGDGSVTLTGQAPAGGVLVAMTAHEAITIPETVKISADAMAAKFTFQIKPTAAPGTVASITAAANGTSASDSITVS